MAKTNGKLTRLMATKPPGTTRLSPDVTKPQPTAPGDAPYDTWDPAERATAVTPDKKAAATAGYQTVNAVIPGEKLETPAPTPGKRTETYKQRGPDGKMVTVQHDLDTGETKITPSALSAAQAFRAPETPEQLPDVPPGDGGQEEQAEDNPEGNDSPADDGNQDNE